MKKNKTITALCVSLLALSSSNSLVYAATTEASSASSQTKVATSSQATSSSSTSATSSQSGQAQSSQNASTSSQTVSVSSLSGNTLSSAALTQSFCVDTQSTRQEIAPGVWYDSRHNDILEITSADGLINWINHVNCGDWKYVYKNVQLDNTIDLAGKFVPTLNRFTQTFDGQGNMIKNWNYGGSSSSAIKNNSGTFKDITLNTTISGADASFINENTGHLNRVYFDGEVSGSGTSLIKTNSGYLNDVKFNGNISGAGVTFIENNKGTINNMVMSGSISGNGGSLIGLNNCGTVNITLADKAVIDGVDVSVISFDGGTSNLTWSPGCQVNDHITNVDQLQHFSFLVATGQTKINGILDNDITFNSGQNVSPIGYFSSYYRTGLLEMLSNMLKSILRCDGIGGILTSLFNFLFGRHEVYAQRYEGTFDGQGHTISNFSSEGDNASFMYENAGTVKHLEITGDSWGTNSSFITKNDGSIQDCVIDMDFDSACGRGPGVTYNEDSGTIRNTFYIGSLNSYDIYSGNEKGVHDFYYYPIYGGNRSHSARKVTKEAVESGEVTQLLNETRAGNSDWSWVQVFERKVPRGVTERPGFSSSNDISKQQADKPTINNIDRTDKSLRVNAQLDKKFIKNLVMPNIY